MIGEKNNRSEKYPLKFESSGCLKEEFDFFTIPIINRIFKSRHVNPFVRVLDYKDKVLLTITLPRYYVSVYSKNLEIIKTLEELRS